MRRIILSEKERKNAQSFDKILVNSFYSRESVLRAYGLESTACYLGTDGELFKPTGELKEDFIIGVGRIGHHKGIDRIIMALGKVDQSTRLPLIWVGDAAQADYMNKMKLLAEKCHVQIQFKVCISDKELISLLSRAKLMVYASRLEPFGFAPLEANACGTPVVAIAEGGVRETIKDGVNGFLVEDADPDIFAKKIKQVLEMPNLDKSNFRARNYVLNDWGWEPAIDRLESSLKSASSKSGVQKP